MRRRRLYVEFKNRRLSLIVPDFFWPELANVLLKAIRQRRLTQETAIRGFQHVQSLMIETVGSFSIT